MKLQNHHIGFSESKSFFKTLEPFILHSPDTGFYEGE